jgi:hypothetical protein
MTANGQTARRQTAAAEPALPMGWSGYWHLTQDGDSRVRAMFDRHYSRRRYRDGRRPKLFVGPGEKMVLLSTDGRAFLIWRGFIDKCLLAPKGGVNCAAFRNEGTILSSALIVEACQLAWERWPDRPLYTYVNPAEIRSVNPGCCFKKAGFVRRGQTAGGLEVLIRHE